MTSPRFTTQRATMAAWENARQAARDPARPCLHFAPPSGWMNDPNGTLFQDGWYHLFYQHHPYSASWDSMHWGHARSRDLVHWEHRPVALCPHVELGETHCYSGSAWMSPDGHPMIMYTSIGDRPPEQWIAEGSLDLDQWNLIPDNPVLTQAAHGMVDVGDWRDPFFFKLGERQCLALGGDVDGCPVVLWYESSDASGKAWHYRGILYSHPDTTLRSLECPNIFQLGDRWVLCFSAYRPVEYVTGVLTTGDVMLQADVHGHIDMTDDFYATNICHDDRGRTILFGWIRGFNQPETWNGVLALPREVTLASDGTLRQQPVEEWSTLRREEQRRHDVPVGTTPQRVVEADTAWELDLTCRIPIGSELVIRLCREDTHAELWTVHMAHDTLGATSDDGIRLAIPENVSDMRLRLLIDRTVAELFADNGATCATRVIASDGCPVYAAVFANGQEANILHMATWKLRGNSSTTLAPPKT